MSAQHTPGPWVARPGLTRWNIVTTGQPRTFNVCSINTDRLEQEANGRLIAASPDLLAALKEAVSLLENGDTRGAWERGIKQAHAAIAKAEGVEAGPPSGNAASTPTPDSRQDKRADDEHARLYGNGGL